MPAETRGFPRLVGRPSKAHCEEGYAGRDAASCPRQRKWAGGGITTAPPPSTTASPAREPGAAAPTQDAASPRPLRRRGSRSAAGGLALPRTRPPSPKSLTEASDELPVPRARARLEPSGSLNPPLPGVSPARPIGQVREQSSGSTPSVEVDPQSSSTQLRVPVVSSAEAAMRLMARRPGLSCASRVACLVGPPLQSVGFRGKGSKHANACGGALAVHAMGRMPPALPAAGAARSAAGLGDVPLLHAHVRARKSERAACALTALLSLEAAAFVLHDLHEAVEARDKEGVAADVIRALSALGAQSLEAAYSALGRLLHWVRTHRPGTSAVTGSVVCAFLSEGPPSSATLSGFQWLRDHCGLDLLSGRAAALRRFRRPPPRGHHVKESFTLRILLGLEAIAAGHASEFVRGHAAGWAFLALHALRVEQSMDLSINAFVPFEWRGWQGRITVAATARDKHPDPLASRPRPVWGTIEGLLEGDAMSRALRHAVGCRGGAVCSPRDGRSHGQPSGGDEVGVLRDRVAVAPRRLAPRSSPAPSHLHGEGQGRAVRRPRGQAIPAERGAGLALNVADGGQQSGTLLAIVGAEQMHGARSGHAGGPRAARLCSAGRLRAAGDRALCLRPHRQGTRRAQGGSACLEGAPRASRGRRVLGLRGPIRRRPG